MRIALVIEEYDPARGGAEQWTYQFARQLAQWGHEIHVVARRFAAIFDHPFVRHYVPQAKSRIEFAGLVEAKLRTFHADVVHDMGAGWQANVFQPHGGSRCASFEQNLQLLPGWMRPAKVRASRLLPRYREFEQLMARQYARDGRIILALSKMVAHDMQRWHGVSRERIRVVYNGVDTVRFSPAQRSQHREALRAQLGIHPEETVLLIMAHNFKLKGVPTLLQTVGQLRREHQPVRLIVAGGQPKAWHERFAQKVGAQPATTFVGAVANPIAYYAAADIYVQPTFYDPCSLVVLEALASGLPVVTSRFNGVSELLTEGVEGYVINDPADPDELKRSLEPLVDVNRRAQMGAAARKLALAHTLERNCREILSVYQELSAGRRRALPIAA